MNEAKTMKQVIAFSMILLLTGCGGGNTSRAGRPAPLRSAPVAFGPISQACIASERKARSRALCGCIQAVADQTLSGSEQRRAARFYSDPQQAQEVRQSDRSSDVRFWEAYAEYGERAKNTCGSPEAS
jgi:hypothetical protein